MKALTFFLPFFYITTGLAQAGTSLDVTGTGNTNGYGQVRFTNAAALGSKLPEQIKDAEIGGSPYLDERWGKAIIVLQNNEAVKVAKLKIDLYRNEVHYIDTLGIELIAESSVIKKVFVLDRKDTSKIAAVFQQITGVDGSTATAFVQVLNNGKAELLRYTHVSVFDKGFDAIAGKNNYSFISKITYCLLNNGVVSPLKSLDEKAVNAIIQPSPQDAAWLLENKNKLRNEREVISFLDYYNGAK